ncbi:hypothetical protein YW3DRAFT_06643 [Streptomyces sp. MnatMP-M77]|uniref:hypothetical protein n=1 Tax=unclassified Streptomyces TaxID=2593676 RepID=UPI000805684C|nr:hypothetical protein [Streptomyces sp. MnatMP-M77]SBV01903.1 hypothetical protein YW3DRAFT_06643 [Streptomyces sp. MnatMP-M77]
MRKTPTAGTAVLACLVMGVALTGCSDGGASQEPSAAQLLDDANAAMSDLTSVTIETATRVTGGEDRSSHLVTDLKATCAYRTVTASGARLDQIRIGGSDYVRPNRTHMEESGRKVAGKGEQELWVKALSSASRPGDELSDCTHDFTSFGKPSKGESSEIDGKPAVLLKVADEENKGEFGFHVATEGKPYILKVVYEDATFHNTTSFSAFDEPLDVRPPDEDEVVDMSGTG